MSKAERKVRSVQVYEALKEEILRGAVAPGSRLIVRELASRFGVSDIPVREALWVLHREGLVAMNAYSGARVAELTRQEVLEVLVVRAELEGLATELAASRLDEEVLQSLRDLLGEMQAIVEARSPDPLAYAALNRDFHSTIFRNCGNGRLDHTIQLLWEGHGQLQTVFRLNPDRLSRSLEEHRAIVAALEARDGDLAGRLAADHKKLQQQDLLTVIEAENARPSAQAEMTDR